MMSVFRTALKKTLTAALCLALPVATYILHWVSLPLVIVVAVCSFALAAFLIRATWRRQPRHIVYAICCLFMILELFLLKPIGRMFGNADMHAVFGHELLQCG